MNKAVFFDRDDTLMVNVPYLGDPTQVKAFTEAAVALSDLQAAGYLIFVISNQSGVGRGLITREQVDAVNVELVRQLGRDYIHTFYHSYATPEDPSATDRKPSPELLHQASQAHNLDLARSYFIGDRLSDIECGLAGGCRTIFLRHNEASPRPDVKPQEDAAASKKAQHVVTHLGEAVKWILADGSAIGNGQP